MHSWVAVLSGGKVSGPLQQQPQPQPAEAPLAALAAGGCYSGYCCCRCDDSSSSSVSRCGGRGRGGLWPPP